jgi:putative ABC transport system permease protein
MLMHLLSDLRYAARRLSGSPGFTAAAVATIAIGVGINTGIFSVLNGFALRDLPVPAAGELVSIYQRIEGIGRNVHGARSMFSAAEYETYRDASETLSGLVAFSSPRRVTLGGDVPQELHGTLVSCNYFDVLRRPLARGPGFGPNDCARGGAAPTVVLGHDLWSTVFAADPDIVGRAIVLNRQTFTVVGVASEGMHGVDLEAASFFAAFSSEPLISGDALFENEQASWLNVIGRRTPGATLQQVRAELGVIAGRIDAEQSPRQTSLIIERAQPLAMPEARSSTLTVAGIVMAAFGLVLLVACANVANLLLARATGRGGEIAVRLSLGASRGRIVQQLLAESALLAALGGLLGSLLAFWSFQSILAFVITGLPEDASRAIIDTRPDARVLAYAFALTLAAGLTFGLLPALRASKRDLHTAMKGAGTMRHRSEGRLQGGLVGAQVAVCMVLMIGASLLLRGLVAAQTVEPGFNYENVTTASFDLVGAGYDEARATEFQRQLMQRLAALPGVESVAQTLRTPLAESNVENIAALPGAPPEQFFLIDYATVSADYFSLLEIPVVRGRAFTAADETNEATVAIVPEATARRLWPGRDPLGEQLAFATGPNEGVLLEIVGVTRDAQITVVGELTSSYVYLPAAPRSQQRQQLLVKSPLDLASVSAAIRREVTQLDPGLVVRVAPLEANLEVWRGIARVVSALATALGIVAVALAAVGVYGAIAYAVGRRVREFGVRIALGAGARDILVLVLKQQLRPVAIGAVIGLAAGIAASRILSSVLFGVSPTDVVALVAAVAVVGSVALVAGFLPARRASRVEPNAVLHYE